MSFISTDTIKYYILKVNSSSNIYSHKYAITLVLEKIIIFVTLLYKNGGYFSFNHLTNHHGFILKITKHKSSQH